jgi:hypothetical protein
MSNSYSQTDADARRIDRERQSLQLHRMAAYWYVCGYNDHRLSIDTYVDPHVFAEHWLTVVVKPSHPSVQDAFKAFVRELRGGSR